MKKQPFLADLPLTVFATARRRLQAAIRNASAIITLSSLNGYSVLFADVLPPDFLAAIDPTPPALLREASQFQLTKATDCVY